MIIKCKMCGGDLNYKEGNTVCECEYCGSRQTIPSADSDKKTNLFNRANRLRMNAEFDKAAAVYASITAEFPEEAEAYWGLCLCKYGIEYVDDPATGNKIPTCHRTLSESIMDDPDFDQACKNADSLARKVYREEAKAIDRLQRDILDIVAREAPYDVFICYKETDDHGDRTEDSVLAQDIYDSLTGKGLKVFFARITLEDKLGRQYEPYIYAALHSARVMVAVGTQYEYFDAVWVKNEWARFLDMMKTDWEKTLIPCYKGIDAYDMPREFKNLQAQDMGKLGWLQDLTRGVMKLCGREAGDQTQQAAPAAMPSSWSASPTVDSLLQRTYLFLEDRDWENASQYADKVLDIDPGNGRAYLAKLLVLLKLPQPELLGKQEETFINLPEAQKVVRFADSALESQFRGWEQETENRQKQKEQKVQKAEGLRRLIAEYEAACQKNIDIQILKDKLSKIKNQRQTLFLKRKELEQTILKQQGIFFTAKRKENENRIQQIDDEIRIIDRDIQELRTVVDQKTTQQFEKIDVEALRYQIGCLFLDIDLYQEAAKEFMQIRNYRDVENIINKNDRLSQVIAEFNAAAKTAALLDKQFSKGNYIKFGKYPQSKDDLDSSPIDWLVLAREGSKALVISRYGLDTMPYHTNNVNITWEKCTLRAWLNTEFLENAFTSKDQAGIVLTAVDNSDSQGYSEWSINGGNNTRDKVFLLSYAEMNKYLGVSNNTKSRVAPTTYALKRGAYTSTSNQTADGSAAGWWWLRSPGSSQRSAALVYSDGSIGPSCVSDEHGCVRPAMWIDLDSGIF